VNRSAIMLAAVALVLAPIATGCATGDDAATKVQGRSGDGIAIEVEGMLIDNATIVAGNPGSGKAAFLGTLYNPTSNEDALISIKAGDSQAELLPEPIPVAGMSAAKVMAGTDQQALFSDFEVPPGAYTDLTLVFESAASAQFEALVVAPYGAYVTAAPEGTDEVVKKVEEHSGGHGGE